jgi:MFS family permease
MFSVPLYFQVTRNMSNTECGMHLVPAVVGNAIGGLLSGVIIKRTGRYKLLVVFSVTCSSLSYLSMMLRWHGNTNWWESLYIIPSGFGTGIAQSALFISLQVVIDPTHMAPAISFMYLSTTIWITIGLPISSAAMQASLRSTLQTRLMNLGLSGKALQTILENATSDVGYVLRTTGKVHAAIVGSYVDGLWWSHAVSLFSLSAGFLLSLFLRQRRLDV